MQGDTESGQREHLLPHAAHGGVQDPEPNLDSPAPLSENAWRNISSPQRQSSVLINVGSTEHKVKTQLREVTYTVKVGKGNGDPLPSDPSQKGSTRRILTKVNATFLPGQLTALMGPSGAGKTTLMNVLTGNCSRALEGDITANGAPIDVAFKSYFNLVPQEDVLLPALTPRETLRYAADLRLPKILSHQEKERRITKILQVLGLDDGRGGGCADTIVGSVEQRGISGGQRKRLSIGLELLTNPSVLFLDEPTSGLDSKAAEDVIRVLRALAKAGKTIVCTIHQPSWKLFERFDRLLLLCKGQVVYDGPTRLVPSYAQRLGDESERADWHIPPRENPIDHVMRIVQEVNDASRFVEAWGKGPCKDPALIHPLTAKPLSGWLREHGPGAPQDRGCTLGQLRLLGLEAEAAEQRESLYPDAGHTAYDPGLDKGEDPPTLSQTRAYENSKVGQFTVLFRRFMYETSKDTKKFIAQCFLKLTVGLMVGLCWFDAARPPEFGDQGQSAFTTTGALFLCVNNCLMDNIFATVIGFPIQRSLLLREYKNGSYSLIPWFFAMFISTMAFQAVYTLILSVPVYLLVGLRLDEVQVPFIFLATLFLSSGIGVALGIAVGATSSDVREAQQKILPTIVPMLLFSGWVIPYDNIPVFLKWVYWISMFQYAFAILKVNQFKDLSFHDSLTTPARILDVPCALITKVNDSDDVCADVGLPEWGNLTAHIPAHSTPIDGTFYLKSQNLDPDSNPIWRNFVILCAYLVIVLFPAYRVIRYKATQKTG